MDLDKENITAMEEEREAGIEENHAAAVDLQTEADLSEHPDEYSGDDGNDQIDFSTFTKEQLVEAAKELTNETDFKKVDRALRGIKPIMDDHRSRERAAALNHFIQEGGVADDFDYKGDNLFSAFDAQVRFLRDRKHQYIRNQEDQKTTNLNKKLEILEHLRVLLDSPEVTNQFNQFKELQKTWKGIGAVPVAQARTLWANYHALVDRFYDNQSIYNELKDLDRKKNLEAKLDLCVRAEKLAEVERLNDAIRELNELHHEFKHTGPVPMEEKEVVWQRFKAASDAVYTRRDEFMKTLQAELNANMERKHALCDEVIPYASFQTDRIKDWNQKTKEILDLQKRWEESGGLPRNKARDINRKFWAAFKTFFANKSAFFKKLDEERTVNLEKKTLLIQQALELKNSDNWDKTANELKRLQQQWKDIGPVPEKVREKIYQEFKEACDYFFEHRRSEFDKKDAEQDVNLKAKVAIIEELQQHIATAATSVEALKDLEEKFNTIGFVPKKDISTIRDRFQKAVHDYVAALPITTDQKAKLLLEQQLHELKNDPNADQKIFQKEQAIRKKMQKVENDIAVWRNNLEFFARAKNGEKVREEFTIKIDEASEHLKQLKQQIKLLRTVS
jgi:hypothetical protein